MYYYIVNKKKIVGFPVKVNLILNNGFEPLSDEQTKFYLEHPDASINEIRNCQIYTPPEPIEPDLQEYVNKQLTELKELCYNSITISTLEYAMANACLAGTSLTYTGDKFYSINEAKAIMKQFMDESAHALTYYKNYKTRINSAQSVEEVDNIMNEIKGILDGSDE